MFGLFQNTPRYAGNGQPITANGSAGVFGFLSALVTCAATPSYAIADKTPSTNTGPILKPAPTTDPTAEQAAPACVESMAMTEGASDELAQPACSVPLPFAIVIQRPQQ